MPMAYLVTNEQYVTVYDSTALEVEKTLS